MREVVNAIFYVLRSGCPWRLLPSDFPPWRTVYRWFAAWREEGLFERGDNRFRNSLPLCRLRPAPHPQARAVMSSETDS